MKRNRIPAAGIAALLLLCLAGCGQQIKEQVSDKVKEEAYDFLMEHGDEIVGAIDDGLDALQEYGAVGRKHYFENETEAESYLLDSLEERYGIEFVIVEQHSYNKHGPIAGDVYVARIAPADSPEQVFIGRAMQTGSVADTYWKIIFQEDLLREPKEACFGQSYIQSYTMELEGGYTERAWEPEDALNEVIEAAQVNISIVLVFEEGRSEEDYADCILLFLENLLLYNQPKADVSLNVRAGEKGAYIFFGMFPKEEGYTRLPREELINSIKEKEERFPSLYQ